MGALLSRPRRSRDARHNSTRRASAVSSSSSTTAAVRSTANSPPIVPPSPPSSDDDDDNANRRASSVDVDVRTLQSLNEELTRLRCQYSAAEESNDLYIAQWTEYANRLEETIDSMLRSCTCEANSRRRRAVKTATGPAYGRPMRREPSLRSSPHVSSRAVVVPEAGVDHDVYLTLRGRVQALERRIADILCNNNVVVEELIGQKNVTISNGNCSTATSPMPDATASDEQLAVIAPAQHTPTDQKNVRDAPLALDDADRRRRNQRVEASATKRRSSTTSVSRARRERRVRDDAKRLTAADRKREKRQVDETARQVALAVLAEMDAERTKQASTAERRSTPASRVLARDGVGNEATQSDDGSIISLHPRGMKD